MAPTTAVFWARDIAPSSTARETTAQQWVDEALLIEVGLQKNSGSLDSRDARNDRAVSPVALGRCNVQQAGECARRAQRHWDSKHHLIWCSVHLIFGPQLDRFHPATLVSLVKTVVLARLPELFTRRWATWCCHEKSHKKTCISPGIKPRYSMQKQKRMDEAGWSIHRSQK